MSAQGEAGVGVDILAIGHLRDIDALCNSAPDCDLADHACAELRTLAPHLEAEDWRRLLSMARSLAIISSELRWANERERAFDPVFELFRCRGELVHRSLTADEGAVIRTGATVGVETFEQFVQIMADHGVAVAPPGTAEQHPSGARP